MLTSVIFRSIGNTDLGNKRSKLYTNKFLSAYFIYIIRINSTIFLNIDSFFNINNQIIIISFKFLQFYKIFIVIFNIIINKNITNQL